MFSNTIQIRATKPTTNSKIGIRFISSGDAIKITKVFEDSIFALQGAELMAGHDVVKINGSKIAGYSRETILAMLASIETEVVFDVKNSMSLKFIQTEGRFLLDQKYETVPLFLKRKGVTSSQWKQIYDSLNDELLIVLNESLEMEQVLKQEMSKYIGKQMNKGYVGWGLESQHEAKVFQMTQQSAAMANTATLVATNILALMNAIMNSRGVLCQLDLRYFNLPKYSYKKDARQNQASRMVGFEFLSIAYEQSTTIPTAQATIPTAQALNF